MVASAVIAAAAESGSAAVLTRLTPSFPVTRISHLNFPPERLRLGTYCTRPPVFHFSSLNRRRVPYCSAIVKPSCCESASGGSTSSSSIDDGKIEEVLRRGVTIAAAAAIGVVVVLSCRSFKS